MFHKPSLNNRIRKLKKRALRLMYKDTTSSFDELLEKENTFTFQQRNIQKGAIEMYKVKHKVAPQLIYKLFQGT